MNPNTTITSVQHSCVASHCLQRSHSTPVAYFPGTNNIVETIATQASMLETEIEQINSDLTVTEGLVLRYGGPVYENSYHNMLCLRDQKKTQFWELLQELERLQELMDSAAELVSASSKSTVLVDMKGHLIGGNRVARRGQ